MTLGVLQSKTDFNVIFSVCYTRTRFSVRKTETANATVTSPF